MIAGIFLAGLVSLVGFVFIMLAPIAVFELIYGRQSVEGAPGHGAAFVFWGGPIAAVAAFSSAIILSFCFYDRFAKRWSPR